MQRGTCPKCGSSRIIKDKPITDKGHYNMPAALSLAILGKRTSWLSREIATGEIRAWICGECGYTELYTTNFRELLEADLASGTSKK